MTGVRLREVVASDLPILYEFERDPVAVRMAAFTPKDPSDRTAFDAHWKRMLADPAITARTVVADGRVVGMVASLELEGEREVTYWIDRGQWGRGIATRALTEFLRIETKRPLFARAAKDNAGSIRVLVKCGFVPHRESRWFANARNAEIEEVVLRLAGPDAEALERSR